MLGFEYEVLAAEMNSCNSAPVAPGLQRILGPNIQGTLDRWRVQLLPENKWQVIEAPIAIAYLLGDCLVCVVSPL